MGTFMWFLTVYGAIADLIFYQTHAHVAHGLKVELKSICALFSLKTHHDLHHAHNKFGSSHYLLARINLDINYSHQTRLG